MDWFIALCVATLVWNGFTVSQQLKEIGRALDKQARHAEQQEIAINLFIRDWRERNGPWPEPHPFDVD